MTFEQIAAEIESVGYGYAAGMIEYCAENYDPSQENFADELFDIITAGGEAFPEQAWGWRGEYEWMNDDGTCQWIGKDKSIISGTIDDFEDCFNKGIKNFINELLITQKNVH